MIWALLEVVAFFYGYVKCCINLAKLVLGVETWLDRRENAKKNPSASD